jgi:HJR/Mrr/RecB family endonuclease
MVLIIYFIGRESLKFGDKLKAEFRTKEFAEREKTNEIDNELKQKADDIFEEIKESILSAANEGRYVETDNEKTVFCIYTLPTEFQFFLSCEKYVTPQQGSLWEREVSTKTIGKKPREVRRILKQYNGVDIFSKGEPAHCTYTFSIKENCKRDFFIFSQRLNQLAIQDDISIKFCIYDEFHDVKRWLPVTVKDEWRDNFDYKLSVECSCKIPEKYSTDNAISLSAEILDEEYSALEQETVSSEGIISVDNMEGHDFEKFCARLLSQIGYEKVDVTRGSGDQGIDIIAYKDGVKFGIQCKCYTSDIGNKAVQEAYSGKSFYNCHVGVVLTNRYFTRAAIELADKNGILLWDRGKLLDLIQNAGIETESNLEGSE